ncbi:hypothetical protein TRFO_05362 [Tritrichomonas foetus]|uniref:Uncharacterized protein n=1 Tax=Tritrichomonas foetus TaxID=1144522 RepID=A0A1J4K7E8_9EUKA|nr:hypothetical protein TRFO_05362 [Tritrichomonas foetus]|eukprot:OHT07123.1 hypothetical protein TRFO_05362 [Tritrichomonas foetus]
MIEEAQKEKEKLEEKLENLYEIATMASEESSIIESEDYEISYEVEQIIQKSLATWFPDIRKAIMTVRSLEKIGEKIIFSLLVKVIEKAVDLNILYSDGEKNSNQSKAFLKALPVNIALMIEKLNSFPQNGIKKLASDIAQQSLKWMTNHASLSCEDYFEMIKDMKPKDKPFAWSFAEKGIFFLSPHAFSSFIDNQRFTYGVIIKEVKWKLNDTTEKLIKTGSYQIVTSNRINMGYLFGPSIGEIQHNRRAEEVNTIIIAVAPNAKVDKQTLLESILLVFPTLIRANSQIQFLSSQTIFSISTHHENELISQFNDTFLRSRESLMMLIRFLHTYSNSSSIFNTKIFLENLLLDSHEKLYIQSYISSCHQ